MSHDLEGFAQIGGMLEEVHDSTIESVVDFICLVRKMSVRHVTQMADKIHTVAIPLRNKFVF